MGQVVQVPRTYIMKGNKGKASDKGAREVRQGKGRRKREGALEKRTCKVKTEG